MTDISCKICNSKLTSVYDFGDMPFVNFFPAKRTEIKKAPLSLGVCTGCWCFQLNDAPKPFDLYNEYHHRSNGSVGNVKHLQAVSEVVCETVKTKKAPKILEVGCNDLTLINFLRDKINGRVTGVDPAQNISNPCETDIYRTFFNLPFAKKISDQIGKQDVILGLNVFAHVPSVLDMFKGVGHLLKHDGVFIFEVAYAFDTILGGIFDTVYHEHFFNWTLSSLEKALGFAGLRTFHVERINTQGGSLRVYARKNPSSIDPSVTKLLQFELDKNVNKLETYQTISSRIETYLKTTHQKLAKCAEKGLHLGIVGAPARGVTFLNAMNNKFGQLDDTRWSIGDDTPDKIGRYFPGTSVKVEKLSLENVEKCDAYFLLAWTYEENLRIRFSNEFAGKEVILPFSDAGTVYG